MATIALYAGKINQMPGLIKGIKSAVKDYKSSLSSIQKKAQAVDSSVCDFSDVVSSIQTSTQTQEEKITRLESFQRNSESFITDVVRTDKAVAETVNKAKKDFYDKYNYLKPNSEKSGWDKFCDAMASTWEWCKEHWKAVATILVVVIAVVALVVITVVTAGTALGPILLIVAGICKGIIAGAVIGGLMGGMTSVADGGSFWEGFEDGAFLGMITGAAFGALGGGFQALGSSCKVLSSLGLGTKVAEGIKLTSKGVKVLNTLTTIAKVSGYTSMGMLGFDFLAKGAEIIWGKDNWFTSINSTLHDSAIYNGIQLITGLTALATGGFAKGMQNPTCFVAGTMILTASGLIAIENIKVGDKVIATDSETFETEEKTVLETYIRKDPKLIHLIINGEEIITTETHPFYVKDRGFVNAGELAVGDCLLDVNSNVLLVDDIKVEYTDEPTTVYNFQVDDFHTYYVGDQCIWVHNANYGGSYKDTKEYNREYNKSVEDPSKKLHAHHMPADSASPLPTDEGPCISMEAGDHMETRSWGSSNDAKAYRAKQADLIEQGKFSEATQMDIDDLHSKFGDKYAEDIAEMLEYIEKLIKEGIIK